MIIKKEVIEGIKAVYELFRSTGYADYYMEKPINVAYRAKKLGYLDTHRWVLQNKKLYLQIFVHKTKKIKKVQDSKSLEKCTQKDATYECDAFPLLNAIFTFKNEIFTFSMLEVRYAKDTGKHLLYISTLEMLNDFITGGFLESFKDISGTVCYRRPIIKEVLKTWKKRKKRKRYKSY